MVAISKKKKNIPPTFTQLKTRYQSIYSRPPQDSLAIAVWIYPKFLFPSENSYCRILEGPTYNKKKEGQMDFPHLE